MSPTVKRDEGGIGVIVGLVEFDGAGSSLGGIGASLFLIGKEDILLNNALLDK
jgi:hypothetical protein